MEQGREDKLRVSVVSCNNVKGQLQFLPREYHSVISQVGKEYSKETETVKSSMLSSSSVQTQSIQTSELLKIAVRISPEAKHLTTFPTITAC